MSTMDASIPPSVAAFQHNTFPDAAGYIRLLEVLSDNHSESIKVRCRLTTFSRDDTTLPPYRTISYTWGDPESNTTILINCKAFRVRTNCEFALKQAYWYEKTYYYWIDAICINQENLEEKSMQVSIMGSIYKRAAHVLACVGDHADDSAFLLHELKQRAFTVKPCGPGRGLYVRLSMRFQLGRRYSTTVRLLHAAVSFMERPYFTRLWVLQEMRNAQEATFLCGSDAVPRGLIHDMSEGTRYMPSSFRMIDKFPSAISMARVPLFRRFWAVGEYQRKSLDGYKERQTFYDIAERVSLLVDSEAGVETLLRVASRLQCQDRKDYIFGLISLIDWGAFAPIVPDYTQTELEVAVAFYQAFLELGQCDVISRYGWVLYLLGLDINSVPSAIESRRIEPGTILAGGETAVDLSHSRYEILSGWRVSSEHFARGDLGFSTWSPPGSEEPYKVYLPSWAKAGDWVVRSEGTANLDRYVVVREAADGLGGRLVGHAISRTMHNKEVARADFGIHWDPEDRVIFDVVEWELMKLGKFESKGTPGWVKALNTAVCKKQTPASSYAVRWDDIS